MTQTTAQWSWFALGLVAAVGAAGVAILGKIGLEGVDTTVATALRSMVMAAILVGAVVATGKGGALVGGGFDRRALVYIVLAGLSGAISWLAYFAALRIGIATKVAAIDRLSLVFVAVFASLFLGERYGWRGWVGVMLVVGGVTLVALDPGPKKEALATEGQAGTGDGPPGPVDTPEAPAAEG